MVQINLAILIEVQRDISALVNIVQSGRVSLNAEILIFDLQPVFFSQ